MKLSSPIHLECIVRAKVNMKSNIDLKFFLEPFADLARCYEFSFASRKRRIVHQKIKCDGRLIDLDRGEWLLSGVFADRITDMDNSFIHTNNRKTPEKIIVREVKRLSTQRKVGLRRRGGNFFKDHIKKRG